MVLIVLAIEFITVIKKYDRLEFDHWEQVQWFSSMNPLD